MASSMGRFLRTARPYRTIVSPKTLNPFVVPSRHPLLPPNYRYRKDHFYSNAFERPRPISGFESSGSFSVCSAIIAGLIGIGLVDIAYADAEQEAVKPALPAECSASFDVMEELARKERHRLEELIKSKGMKYGAFPMFTVAVKGQKVTIRFRIPPSCEIPHLIANLVSNLGLKVKEHGAGSEMLLRAWDSAVAWQLTLSNPEKQKEGGGMQGLPGYTNEQKGDLCILIFHSLISADKAEIEFIKQGSFSPEELDALVSAMQLVGEKMGGNKNLEMKPKGDTSVMPSIEKSISSLEALGVRVFGLDVPQLGFSSSEISWENIAGYDKQKREIEDTVLLALHSPEVYDDIARGTRCKFESNRPRAVLFEGPPGTGKTSCARVIANQAGVPLLYVPLEAIVSKYYGESERSLGKVFKIANELPNGAIIFLDEVDSFAVTRDSDIHEATRRMLSVLLRQMDGYEQDKKVVVIAATNRKQDLDPALLSRFNTMITFGLPDQQNREAIAAQFAKHLKKSELVEFARVTEEMSGRDIRDVCQQAERRWASKIIRGQAARDGDKWHLPPLQEYINSAMDRQKAMREIGDQKFRNPNTWKPKLDFS